MDNHPNSFGLRLRAYVEKRSTIEKAYAALGISRSTLFNWFDLSDPPDRDSSRAKLRAYLGSDSDHVLWGGVSDSDSKLEESGGRYLVPSLGDSPSTAIGLRGEIHGLVSRLLAGAGSDVARLGWLLEEIRATERETAHWSVSAEQQSREAAIVEQMKRDRLAGQRQAQSQSSGEEATGR